MFQRRHAVTKHIGDLESLARKVSAFYPEIQDTFICPVCLKHFPGSVPIAVEKGVGVVCGKNSKPPRVG